RTPPRPTERWRRSARPLRSWERPRSKRAGGRGPSWHKGTRASKKDRARVTFAAGGLRISAAQHSSPCTPIPKGSVASRSASGMAELDDLKRFELSHERGFLPAQDPVRALPRELALWDELG